MDRKSEIWMKIEKKIKEKKQKKQQVIKKKYLEEFKNFK